MPTQLSPNFTLEEFTASVTASSRGISNQPDKAALSCIKDLVELLLQPMRTALGKPFKITSGYRSPALNTAVGSVVKGSQHTLGQAADIQVQGMTPLEVAKFVVASGLEFDQVIDEGTWLHISFVKGKNRKQALTAVFTEGKPTTYKLGLKA